MEVRGSVSAVVATRLDGTYSMCMHLIMIKDDELAEVEAVKYTGFSCDGADWLLVFKLVST
ncbi:MAG: hypothetical protein IAA97_03760 [Spirochaetes bacterium]|uniref:Uncharacterized protein n=1 Tax=Candidatus Ornithospirochaeta stercoripullorum TaxID=2840899 RepID=A0A9D9E1C7_9SPIO|nr:hypothetical protein [Candidatus Ornithospirochaeta stercoripullorum]